MSITTVLVALISGSSLILVLSVCLTLIVLTTTTTPRVVRSLVHHHLLLLLLPRSCFAAEMTTALTGLLRLLVHESFSAACRAHQAFALLLEVSNHILDRIE